MMRTSLTVLWLLVGTSAVVVPGHQGHLADDSDKMREEENDAFLEAATAVLQQCEEFSACNPGYELKSAAVHVSGKATPAYGTQTLC